MIKNGLKGLFARNCQNQLTKYYLESQHQECVDHKEEAKKFETSPQVLWSGISIDKEDSRSEASSLDKCELEKKECGINHISRGFEESFENPNVAMFSETLESKDFRKYNDLDLAKIVANVDTIEKDDGISNEKVGKFEVRAASDGSSLGGKGVSYVIRYKNTNVEVSYKIYEEASAQEVEVIGFLLGLIKLNDFWKRNVFGNDTTIVMITDSSYVAKGVSEFMENWSTNGWKRYGGGEIKHVEFWKRIKLESDKLGKRFQVRWTRGHKKCQLNIRAVELARKAALDKRIGPLSKKDSNLNKEDENEEDEEDEELKAGEKPDLDWIKEKVLMKPEIFKKELSGVKVPIYDRTPLGYFKLLLTKDIIKYIIMKTNRYASTLTLDFIGPKKKTRCKNWKPLTEIELLKFIGFFIGQSFVQKPTLESYYEKDSGLIATPNFKKIISYDRLVQIEKFLHFSNEKLGKSKRG
uniref:RNase H domain-containing protein n=1 Tax=Parastrongyloides trichosuri TaxID=131310 RepID=A0A0N5A061_PARTI